MSQRACGAPLPPLGERANVARLFLAQAARRPEALAIAHPQGRGGFQRICYRELEQRVRRIASALSARGVRPGERACLFVRPGSDLIAITYALFLLGAVPVIADPGMGRKRLLAAIERMRPGLFFGIPLAQAARRLWRGAFRSVRLSVAVGRGLTFGAENLQQLCANADPNFEVCDTRASDPAAILFTSGSTGPPKGVLYTHANFMAQVQALAALYAFQPGEVDLACFPLFALFDGALGMTSVFPAMDVSHPGRCDPHKIVQAVHEFSPSLTFGSPAIWRRVVPYCKTQGIALPSLRRVLIAGAPVPAQLIADFQSILPTGAQVHTPYGATESLPVTSISSDELFPERVAKTWDGVGTCVGRPAPGIEIRIAKVVDRALECFTADLEQAAGHPGEVCVRGPVVTELYAEDQSATVRAKLAADDGGPSWHRMGDIGRLDEEGYLWFHGRMAHRLETAKGLCLPVPAENVFNQHPHVLRSALVGIGERGAERPLLVVEPHVEHYPKDARRHESFLLELRALGRKSPVTRDIELFLFRRDFPVDVRHNAKIDREALKAWAQLELRKRGR